MTASQLEAADDELNDRYEQMFSMPNTASENAKFSEIYESKRYTSLVSFYEYILGTNLALHLCRPTVRKTVTTIHSSTIHKLPIGRSVLRPKNPIIALIHCQSAADRVAAILSTLIFCAMIYWTISKSLIAVLQYRQDRLLRVCEPRLQEGATTWEQCALPDQLYLPQHLALNECSQMLKLRQLLTWLGDTFVSVTGVACLDFGLMALGAMLFHPLLLRLLGEGTRSDALAYLVDNKCQRLQLQQDTNIVISNLADAFQLRSSQQQQQQILINLYEADRLQAKSWKEGETIPPIADEKEFNCDLYSELNTQQFDRCYEETLLDPHLQNYVQPVVASRDTLTRLMEIESLFRYTFIIGQACSWTIYMMINVLELLRRTRQRKSDILCSNWQKGAISLEQTRFYLDDLRSSSDLQAYLGSGDSKRELLQLALTVEFKYFVSFSMLLTNICCLYYIHLIVVAFWTHYFMYIRDYWLSMRWQNQITSQADLCRNLMLRLSRQIVIKPDDRLKTTRALLITYINYELFRRHHSANLHYNNLVLLLTTAFSVGSLIVCYLLGTRTDFGLGKCLIFVVSSQLVLFSNVQLLMSGYMMNKIKKLLRKPVQLMVAGALNRLESAQVMKLWQRELIGKEPVDTRFANTILGYRLTYDRVLTLDFYLLLLWQVLL